jgi:hypothetical protein
VDEDACLMNAQRGLEWTLLLLADGFSETQAALYVSELRGVGLPLKIVGLTKRAVQSEHGIKILPDFSIDTVIQKPFQIRLLILPGGKATATAWRADPRTQLLFDLVRGQGGYLVAAPESVEVVESIAAPSLSLRLHQGPPNVQDADSFAMHVLVAPADYDGSLKTFVQKLIKLLDGAVALA